MKKLNSVKWMLFAISFLSLLSCTPNVPDVAACEHMEQQLTIDPITKHVLLRPSPTCMKNIKEIECGHCVTIVSKKEFFVGEADKYHYNEKPWSQIRRESALLPAEESYGPLSTYIINACKKMNCNDQVNRYKVKLNVFNLLEKP